MRQKLLKWVISGGFLFCCLIAGFVLGGLANRVMRPKAEAEQRRVLTQELLKNKPIEVGMILNDGQVEDLERNKVDISELVQDTSVIVVTHPNCDACKSELKHLKAMKLTQICYQKFLWVTSYNPRLLEDLSDTTDIPVHYLYDHRKQWLGQFDITDFPFVIVVDRNLRVLSIVVGGIIEDDVREMCS